MYTSIGKGEKKVSEKEVEKRSIGSKKIHP